MSMLYIGLGTQEELKDQIIECALEQACLALPWPLDKERFDERCAAGKTRFGLLAREAARLAGDILDEWSACQKKLPQAKGCKADRKSVVSGKSVSVSVKLGGRRIIKKKQTIT